MKVNIDTSDMLYAEAWNGFKGTDWKEEINVRDFIQHNYTPYEGDESSSPKQRLRPLHCGKK
jgi:formate C-acetyltransferase